MKKLMYSILFCTCFLFGCAKTIELQKQTFTIELGQDVYGNPALYMKNPDDFNIENISVAALDKTIAKKDNRFTTVDSDYLVCGVYDFEIIAGGQRVPFKIKIKDTQPPSLQKSPDTLTVKQNQEINWQEVFEASDLSGVSYEAPGASTALKGSKDVVVTIQDKFGNSTQRSIYLIVE